MSPPTGLVELVPVSNPDDPAAKPLYYAAIPTFGGPWAESYRFNKVREMKNVVRHLSLEYNVFVRNFIDHGVFPIFYSAKNNRHMEFLYLRIEEEVIKLLPTEQEATKMRLYKLIFWLKKSLWRDALEPGSVPILPANPPPAPSTMWFPVRHTQVNGVVTDTVRPLGVDYRSPPMVPEFDKEWCHENGKKFATWWRVHGQWGYPPRTPLPPAPPPPDPHPNFPPST